jgi:hypothetical protein
MSRWGRARARSFLGDQVGADESMNEMLRLAEAQRQVGVLVWALFWASLCCLVERDFKRARWLARGAGAGDHPLSGQGEAPGAPLLCQL